MTNILEAEKTIANKSEAAGVANAPNNPRGQKTDLPTGEDLPHLLDRAEMGDVIAATPGAGGGGCTCRELTPRGN